MNQLAHDLGHALLVLAATPVDVFEKLGGWKGGLALLVLTFFAGGGSAVYLGDLRTHEGRLEELEIVTGVHADRNLRERVASLETYRDNHESNVVRPRVEQLVENTERLGRFENRMTELYTTVGCIYWEIPPAQCPGESIRPPTN